MPLDILAPAAAKKVFHAGLLLHYHAMHADVLVLQKCLNLLFPAAPALCYDIDLLHCVLILIAWHMKLIEKLSEPAFPCSCFVALLGMLWAWLLQLLHDHAVHANILIPAAAAKVLEHALPCSCFIAFLGMLWAWLLQLLHYDAVHANILIPAAAAKVLEHAIPCSCFIAFLGMQRTWLLAAA